MIRRKAKTNHTGPESAGSATGELYELIASRAYEVYESRGAGGSDELADWLTAEQEILAGIAGLKAKIDNVVTAESAPAHEPRKKSSKLTSLGGSRKKAGPAAASTAKSKTVHP
jgi:hypothetical protein